MVDFIKYIFWKKAMSSSPVVKMKEAIAPKEKLQVRTQSANMIFYFLVFSATTNPGTQSYKFTIIVNPKQINNSG